MDIRLKLWYICSVGIISPSAFVFKTNPPFNRTFGFMPKLMIFLLPTLLIIASPNTGLLYAQQQTAVPATTEKSAPAQAPGVTPTERDTLHLNTIGAFSAGFVLQSYGYIGVLADALGSKVYKPELVRSMLAETVSYLKNVNVQLQKYQTGGLVAAGDQKFIVSMIKIINLLITEAEALSSFAQTKSKEDFERYDTARKNAWKDIEKTFGMK